MHLQGIAKQVVCILLSLLFSPLIGQTVEQAEKTDPDRMVAVATRNVDREWVTEKNGTILPLETMFVDENGNEVSLDSLIDRPTLILPIYFYCPGVCSKNLANMAVAMNRLNFEPGRDYKAIALSFSDTENAEVAMRAKKNYLKLLYDGFPGEEWAFLTGSREAIEAVTDAMGYRFQRMSDETFIHPSAIVVVDAEGKIIRYVYGSFVPGDIDLAIASAREGVPLLSVKRFLEFCFNYDPDAKKPVYQYVKIAVLLFFAVTLTFVVVYFGRKRKKDGKEG